MEGILYGIGVGPGDPELLTLKAARLIRECQVIAAPDAGKDRNVALEIARGAVPELDEKEFAELFLPMTRDKQKLEESHQKAADQVLGYLKQGKSVAFLTLGDPTVYSTYLYVHERVVAAGARAEIIPGVPSFCAVAARLGVGLTEASEPLRIIPGSYPCVEQELDGDGAKVLMKSGKAIEQVKELLKEKGMLSRAMMVQNCGMENERVFHSLENADHDASYFSVIIVK